MGTHPIFESDFDCLTEWPLNVPLSLSNQTVSNVVWLVKSSSDLNNVVTIVAMKLCRPGKEHLEKHYADLSSKGFFAGLIEYMNSGPTCVMVWEGKNVVKMGRMMLGETNPQASLPGSIRGDFSIEVGRNICHGSDAVESANAEIALWFKPEELISWESASAAWVYE